MCLSQFVSRLSLAMFYCESVGNRFLMVMLLFTFGFLLRFLKCLSMKFMFLKEFTPHYGLVNEKQCGKRSI